MPADRKERAKTLKSLAKEERTVIFYEAPHRLAETLGELIEAAGDRNAACVREITKKFEEVRKDRLSGLISYYKNNVPRGEFVLVLEGADAECLRREEIENFEKMTLEEHMELYTNKGLSEKEAMKQVAKDRGVSKRDIYSILKTEGK